MPTDKDLTIHVKYTGTNPNIQPAARAFARMIREATNLDGTFKDPELEAEFQEWLNARKESA